MGDKATEDSGNTPKSQPATTSAFGQSLFGQTAGSTFGNKAGVFGAPSTSSGTSSPSGSAGIFGGISGSSNLFGAKPGASQNTGLFGGAQSAANPGAGLFASAGTPSLSGPNLFNSLKTTATSDSTPSTAAPGDQPKLTGLFGNVAKPGNSGALFGSAATSLTDKSKTSGPAFSFASPSVTNTSSSQIKPVSALGAPTATNEGAQSQGLLFGSPSLGASSIGQQSSNLAAANTSTPSTSKPPPSFPSFSTTPAGEPPNSGNGGATSIFGGLKQSNQGAGLFPGLSKASSGSQNATAGIFGNQTSQTPTSAETAGDKSKNAPSLFAGTGTNTSSNLFGKSLNPSIGASGFQIGTASQGTSASQSQEKGSNLFGAPSGPKNTLESTSKQPLFGNVGSTSSQATPNVVSSSAPMSALAASKPPSTFSFASKTTTTAPAQPTLFSQASTSTSTAASGAASLPAQSSATTPSTTTAAPSTGVKASNQPSSFFGVSTASQQASSAPTTSAAPAASSSVPPTSTSAPVNSATSARAGAPETAEQKANTAGPAPTPQSRLKNKSMEEIVQDWSTELSKHQNIFQKQAEQVAKWDRLLIDNQEKIGELYGTTFQAERESTEIERQLTQLEGQQTELMGWLDRYEQEVDDKIQSQVGVADNLQGPDHEREQTYLLAEKLSKRMDEMGKDLSLMIEEVNNASSALSKTSKPDDPLTQIVRILNSHLSSLQWIDQNATALQAKVKSAQRDAASVETYGVQSSRDDDVNDFYRSLTGRR